MKIGKRDFDWSREEVIEKMRGRSPEPIRDHVVVIEGVKFPPKQVIAAFISMNRQNFTTQGAQRVLTTLGFQCLRQIKNAYGHVAWLPENEHALRAASEVDDAGIGADPEPQAIPVDRLAAIEAALAMAQEAIMGLGARVRLLEEGGN